MRVGHRCGSGLGRELSCPRSPKRGCLWRGDIDEAGLKSGTRSAWAGVSLALLAVDLTASGAQLHRRRHYAPIRPHRRSGELRRHRQGPRPSTACPRRFGTHVRGERDGVGFADLGCRETK